MLESYPWLSILPPLIAIAIAIKSRQVFAALFIGLWTGASILADGNIIKGFADTLDLMIDVFKDEGNTKVILFTLLIGSIVAFIQSSGGVSGFIELVASRKWIDTRKKAQIVAMVVGCIIVVETNISVLVTGTIARPIFDKMKISREKLAYICDSTCAPVCCLVPVNAWAAYAAGLLAMQDIKEPFKMYVLALPMNFYAIFSVILVALLVFSGKDFFSMKKAEKRAKEEGKVLRDGAVPMISTDVVALEPKEGVLLKASNMLVPIVAMILMMVAGMFITGNGDFVKGSGSTSVFWAIIAAVLSGGILYKVRRIFSFKEMVDLFFKGAGGLVPLAVLMVFAYAIGQLCRDLNTGPYVAGVTSNILSPVFLPAVIFIITSFIAFSIGSSWGTWGIMFPIGIGIVQSLNLPVLPVISALLSGGVFGDHCSPISDTTLVSSMASASDHMDHVNTQLPYALTAGVAAAVFFVILGFVVY
ncbi:Na+/H+ antiporter NhaC family protein [candidate division KSB1 bacterium]